MNLRRFAACASLVPALATLGACGSSSNQPGGGADQAGQAAGGNAGGGMPASGGGIATGGSASSNQSGASAAGAAQGGAVANGGAASGGMTAGGAVSVAAWQAPKAAGATDQLLQTEYAAWKSAHAQACANGSWVVVKDGSVVSEGIGYGMLLAAGMNDQPLFDGLYRYYTEHADTNGLMNWATGLCDAPGNNMANAATDGDLDAAMALLQAHARWAGGNYLEQAKALAGKIAMFESETCGARRVLKPGDAFGGCSDKNGQDKLNPSYFAPGYYRVFAHYFPDQASVWTALTDGSYELYAVYQARMANLVPDWSKADGSDWYGAAYYYDACRTPWRVAVDYGFSLDPRAKTFLGNIASWVDGKGGLPGAAQEHNSAFIGAFALAGVYDQAKLDGYVTAWLADTQSDDAPYFQGTLRVLYLMTAAGRFSSTL
jgi:Glycosyl hydrolases family 8